MEQLIQRSKLASELLELVHTSGLNHIRSISWNEDFLDSILATSDSKVRSEMMNEGVTDLLNIEAKLQSGELKYHQVLEEI